ncbi:Inorganic pyrophosphatase 2 [Linum grandiflorum]
MSSGVVVLYDFDETIVGVDTDYWLIDEFGYTDLADQLRPDVPWNSIIDRMLKEIQEHGKKTIDDIVAVLKRIPILPRVVSSIKSAHDLGCELRIVSDSNVFFIEKVLENLGVRRYFSEINTNSGFLDDQGRLRVAPYHDFTKASHGCTLCPPNMCKVIISYTNNATLGLYNFDKSCICTNFVLFFRG